jgi:selenophosphate synthetase-related protein
MMTREEIIRMAREAGLDPDLWNYTDAFERFAALVAAHEREACAELCEQHGLTLSVFGWVAKECAEAIRARDKQ